ncbi:MAG: hypothetical protein GY810_15130 [Aureispira sp.]|nr:hypothetical protein [Aureispira sp.]
MPNQILDEPLFSKKKELNLAQFKIQLLAFWLTYLVGWAIVQLYVVVEWSDVPKSYFLAFYTAIVFSIIAMVYGIKNKKNSLWRTIVDLTWMLCLFTVILDLVLINPVKVLEYFFITLMRLSLYWGMAISIILISGSWGLWVYFSFKKELKL